VLKIIQMSAAVIAGNDYLRNYALRHNENVILIPSSVDTERYVPSHPQNERKSVVIGWIGSNTTKNFLYDLKGVFAELSKRYANLEFEFVGARFYGFGLGTMVNKEWSLGDELTDLQGFDIGIMPMPDNEWTRGKCGFKALLYMSCGIPVIASPVGVNAEIVEDGVNGFLASSEKEWSEKLSLLIEDKALRGAMGKRGREEVVERYSLRSSEPLFYKTLMEAHAQKRRDEIEK
jgi:glycosyltransferase involved in cell wall biosynthesis